jgi:hypothetical protein
VTARRNCEERLNHEFAPYLACERYPEIEADMWQRGTGNIQGAFAWLCTCMCSLFMACAILRCESLLRAELSDFVGIANKNPL